MGATGQGHGDDRHAASVRVLERQLRECMAEGERLRRVLSLAYCRGDLREWPLDQQREAEALLGAPVPLARVRNDGTSEAPAVGPDETSCSCGPARPQGKGA